jgi:thioredoxin reductase (NADPH)/alkyl hydroperoxide reductase subunit F
VPPAGADTVILGGDRPLGTWLRTHSKAQTRLHVLFLPADDYKMAEVAGDDRVQLCPVAQATVTEATTGRSWDAQVVDRSGRTQTLSTVP